MAKSRKGKQNCGYVDYNTIRTICDTNIPKAVNWIETESKNFTTWLNIFYVGDKLLSWNHKWKIRFWNIIWIERFTIYTGVRKLPHRNGNFTNGRWNQSFCCKVLFSTDPHCQFLYVCQDMRQNLQLMKSPLYKDKKKSIQHSYQTYKWFIERTSSM